MHSNIINVLERNLNSRFLVNISFTYEEQYKLISNFFGFTFTKNSYKFFLKGNAIRGFNNSFNVFLCPWQNGSIKYYIKHLKEKQEKEHFDIDALIVNGRLLNIYVDRNIKYLYNILENVKLPLFNLESFINFFFLSFLNFNLKYLFFQLKLLMISVEKKDGI